MIYVAELSINHLGMLNIAKAMIKSAKKSGANYVKIKIKKVNKYYTSQQKKWRGYNFIKYRESLELSKNDIRNLVEYCKESKIGWFSTVHDIEGLNFIKKLKPSFIKIASMDNKNSKLIKEAIKTCKTNKVPLIISLGGQDKTDTHKIIKLISEKKIRCYLLHCVSIYPTPPGESNINYIDYLIKKYQSKNIKIGYSGHEEGFTASLLASLKNIHMIERHFSLDNHLKIHHIKSSIQPEEFLKMKNTIESIKKENYHKSNSLSSKELDFLKKRIYK